MQMETKRKQEILISDKIDFEIKAGKRDKEGHYIMIKGSIKEDITIINYMHQHRSTTICKANAKGSSLDRKHRKGV